MPLLREVDICDTLVEVRAEDLENLKKFAIIRCDLDYEEPEEKEEQPYIDTYYLKLDNEIKYFDMILDDVNNYIVYEGVLGQEFKGYDISFE